MRFFSRSACSAAYFSLSAFVFRVTPARGPPRARGAGVERVEVGLESGEDIVARNGRHDTLQHLC